MTGPELSTFCDELNGGATIGDTLKSGLLNLDKAMIEQKRPWMVLRSTDSSKTVTAANTWQTAIDLSAIARFNRFYGEDAIQLFDGSNRIQRFRQVPWILRLQYKDTPGTFAYERPTEAAYVKWTPIWRPVCHTISHDRFKSSGLIISVKLSGMITGAGSSIRAPVGDRLRMMHSTMPPGSEIDPPLKVRCLYDLRLLSSMARTLRRPQFQSRKIRSNSSVNSN